MTGPEHFRAAERCRERASQAQNAAYDGATRDGWEKAAYWNDSAQVHATLAQAAATIETIAARAPGDLSRDWEDIIYTRAQS
jgi:hypothetical protein